MRNSQQNLEVFRERLAIEPLREVGGISYPEEGWSENAEIVKS